MREAEVKKLYNSITNVREKYVEEARAVGQIRAEEETRVTGQARAVEKEGQWGRKVGRIGQARVEEMVRDVGQARGVEEARVAGQERTIDVAGVIKQSTRQKRKFSARYKWCILVVCLCLAAGVGVWALLPRNASEGSGNGSSDSCFWGGEDCSLLEAHREDFLPGLSAEEEAAFADAPGVMKIYRTIYNSWFLAEDLTDFSQILTTDPLYIVHGSTNYRSNEGNGRAENGAYGVYTLDENGEPQWGMGVSAPDNNIVPYELCYLTYGIIEEDLAGIDYEDYIITQSTRLSTVIIWARCVNGEDMFVTYPARPEFVGLENRGRYTLEELQRILREAYYND